LTTVAGGAPKVLGLIPARGGSKSIPRKNLAPLGGKPLIAWTCEAARAASSLDRSIVSTDDDAIAAAA
jgi:CMP-N,N'-diacetyllegionaminic acid synthase